MKYAMFLFIAIISRIIEYYSSIIIVDLTLFYLKRTKNQGETKAQ